MNHYINNNLLKGEYSNEFMKGSEKNEDYYNNNLTAELSFNQREIELLKNKLMEKDLIINKLNYQVLKQKEDVNKLLNERDCQKFEIKDIQENYEKCLNENLVKTQSLNELRENNLHVENENYHLKNDLNKKSFKLNEISINYDKLRLLYNEIKTEKEKLNENFIKLNQENFEVRRELAAKKNLDLNCNLQIKNSNYPKANLESEINFRINSTNISSTDRIINFNSKDSERNVFQNVYQNFSNNNVNNDEVKKSPDYITDSSYAFSNNNAFERAASPYLIGDLEENSIDYLKISKNMFANKNAIESNNYDLKKEENFPFSDKINNHNNNLTNRDSKWNKNNNYALVDCNVDDKEFRSSFQSNSDLLRKNFMIKLNDKQKQSEENNFQEELYKHDLSAKEFDNNIDKENFIIRDLNKLENKLNSDRKTETKSKHSKEASYNQNEIIKKFSKPPNVNVKDLGKRCKTAKNLKDKDRNTIEIIDNQSKQNLKNELITKSFVINDNQKISNSLNLRNKSFSERSITTERNLTHSKNGGKNIFEKFKIESTKENNSITNSNNGSFIIFEQKSNSSKINNVKKNDHKIIKTNKAKEENKIKESKKEEANEIFILRNAISQILHRKIDKNHSPKSNQKINILNKIEKNLHAEFKKIEDEEKIKLQNPSIASALNFNNPKAKQDSIEEINLQKKKSFQDLNKKENIDLNLKQIESFIKNNGLHNPIGSFLKTSADNLEKLTNQAEKILLSCKSQDNLLLNKNNQIIPKNNFTTITNTSIKNEKAPKEILLEEIRNQHKNNNRSKEFPNQAEYNCNLNCEINESYDNYNSEIHSENNTINSISRSNNACKNNEINNFNNNLNVNYDSNLLAKSIISDNNPYNSNFNIYSNLNLSALNKINEKIENLHPNFNKSPAYIIKKPSESNAEKANILKDEQIDKNMNIASSSKKSFPSSKKIFNSMKSNFNNKKQIEVEDYLEINTKEVNSDNSKGSVFHYQNKILSEENFNKKKNLIAKKPKIYTIETDRLTKSSSNNILNNNNNDKEVNFLGITNSQIIKYKNNKSQNLSKDENKLAKSQKLERNQKIYDVKDLDFCSLVENEKIIQFSKNKQKIVQELSKMAEFPKTQKQIMKKRQLVLNLNEINKVLSGVVNIFGNQK